MTATTARPEPAASAGPGANGASAAPAERYEPALPIAQIVESPLNPRTHYDKAKLQELADSLKAKGQLVPVLLRPRRPSAGPTRRYDLAAGHRRLKATKLNGDTTIAAVIREMDDATFLEVLTVENMQRDDLTPLEEAAGYAMLLKLPGYDVPTIAAKVSKSESYVYRRLALANLSEPAKKALAKDEIEFGHAEILCRVPDAAQKELLASCRKTGWNHWSVGELRRRVAEYHLLKLSAAPWKLGDATLPGGACSSCPKRTGATPALFSDLATDDRCTDGACHKTKLHAFLARRETELRTEHGKDLVLLDKDPYGRHDMPTPKGAVSCYNLEVVKKGTTGAQPALIARSDKGDVGQVVYVRKPVTRKAQKTTDRYQREAQERYEKARRKTKAHVAAALAAGTAADVTALAKVPQLPVLVAGALAQMSGDTNNLLKHVEWVPKECTTRPNGVKALAAITALGASEQARLLVLLTLLPYVQVHAYAVGDGAAAALARFCNEFGVSVARHVTAAEKAHQAEVRAKKAKKAKKAKGKKATKKPAKKAATRRSGDVARDQKGKPAARDVVWEDKDDEDFD